MAGRVAVAVSGGVDSLCALMLLKRAGKDVFAIHGLFSRGCGSFELLEKNCAALGVRLHAVNLAERFAEDVIRPFAADYASGFTPNPCASCNRLIKFGALLDAALALGAARMATGHYARISANPQRGKSVLAAARDRRKDQSYFLSLVSGDRLKRAIFPLAGMEKARCRGLVLAAGLKTPPGGESQDICFVPAAWREFLHGEWRRHGLEPSGPGPVLLASGTPGEALREIGRHQGLWLHTIGQRRGLGIPFREPLYVIGKDFQGNALVVGPRRMLGMSACIVKEVNMLVEPRDWPGEVFARTRHGGRLQRCLARPDNAGMRLEFLEPRFPAAPGQVAAIYNAEGAVLAGGIIKSIEGLS